MHCFWVGKDWGRRKGGKEERRKGGKEERRKGGKEERRKGEEGKGEEGRHPVEDTSQTKRTENKEQRTENREKSTIRDHPHTDTANLCSYLAESLAWF